jgi:hypothetical protein
MLNCCPFTAKIMSVGLAPNAKLIVPDTVTVDSGVRTEGGLKITEVAPAPALTVKDLPATTPLCQE